MQGKGDGQAEAEQIERDRVRKLEVFRAKALTAFATGLLHCDCRGVLHGDGCPLGELEVEADALWRAKLEGKGDRQGA